MVERTRSYGGDRGGREPERGSRDTGRGRDDPPVRSGRDDDRGSRGREPERGGRDSGRDSGRGGGSSRGYVYTPRGADQVAKRQSMGANEFDKIFKSHIKMYTAHDGLNRLRILPPTWAKPEHFGYDVFVHYGVGPDRDSYLDLQKMLGEPDPITEEQVALRRSGDASEQEIKDLESKRRVAVYVVDRDAESEGVQAWTMPWTIDRDINGVSVDHSNGEVLQIDDPENGYDIEFTKTGKGINTKYGAIAIARRSSRLGKAEWLDFAIDNPIPDQLQYFTYDEIAKTFGGGGAHREQSRDAPARDDRDVGGRAGDDRSPRGGRDVPPARTDRDRGRSEDLVLTWDDIHGMTGAELDALVDADDRLHGIDVNKAETDEQLADWVCEDLKIDKVPPRGRTRTEAPAEDRDAGDRLAAMREQRSRR